MEFRFTVSSAVSDNIVVEILKTSVYLCDWGFNDDKLLISPQVLNLYSIMIIFFFYFFILKVNIKAFDLFVKVT